LIDWQADFIDVCKASTPTLHHRVPVIRLITCIHQVRGEYDIDEMGNGPEGEWGEGDIDGSLVRQAEERRREKVSPHPNTT
jgi:hypothetical protein